MLHLIYIPVRGMMYYRKALELQAFLDMAKEEGNLYMDVISNIVLTFAYGFDRQYIVLFGDYFYRIIGRLQGSWIFIWRSSKSGKIFMVSMSGCGGYEIYICCFLSTIWYWQMRWSSSCTGHSKAHDCVSVIFRLFALLNVLNWTCYYSFFILM